MIHNIKHGGLISELIENGWIRLYEPLQYDVHNGNHGLITTLLKLAQPFRNLSRRAEECSGPCPSWP